MCPRLYVPPTTLQQTAIYRPRRKYGVHTFSLHVRFLYRRVVCDVANPGDIGRVHSVYHPAFQGGLLTT